MTTLGVLVLLLGCSTGACSKPRVSIFGGQTHRRSTGDARDAAAAHRKMFGSDENIRKWKQSRNHGTAMRAAWEQVRHVLPDPPQNDALAVDPAMMNRFLGFVEGRLGVEPPRWWNETMLDSQAYDRDNVFFVSREPAPCLRTQLGPVAPQGTSLVRDSHWIRIESGGQSFNVSSSILERDGNGFIDGVSCAIGESRCFVATYFDRCVPYRLVCVEKYRRQPVWSAEVWAAGGIVNYTGVGFHCVTVVVRGSTVILFGAGDDCAYIEGFQCDSGANVFRFSTSY